jgi:hypothetical protein
MTRNAWHKISAATRGTIAFSCHGRRGPTVHGFAWTSTVSRGWPAFADHEVASRLNPRHQFAYFAPCTK